MDRALLQADFGKHEENDHHLAAKLARRDQNQVAVPGGGALLEPVLVHERLLAGGSGRGVDDYPFEPGVFGFVL